MRAKIILTLFVAAALVLPAFSAAADDTRWLHVTVVEAEDGTNVELNLPLSLVRAVIEGVEVDGFNRGKVELDLDDVDIDWVEVLAAVRTAPDGDFVRVDSDDGKVEISKKNDTVKIHIIETDGDQAVVDITLPVSLIDAFSVDDDDQIDVAAMLDSIADQPAGELIRVTSDDVNVRIWVD